MPHQIKINSIPGLRRQRNFDDDTFTIVGLPDPPTATELREQKSMITHTITLLNELLSGRGTQGPIPLPPADTEEV